jgi:sporulation protein YqfC
MKFTDKPVVKSAKANALSNLVNIFELPAEVLLNLPKITIIGSKSISVENYIGITEYSEHTVGFNTSVGQLKIYGDKFEIQEISEDLVQINGKFTRLEYLNNG